MTRPALIVIDDDPGSLATLDDALRRRYDRDYAIISENSPSAAPAAEFLALVAL